MLASLQPGLVSLVAGNNRERGIKGLPPFDCIGTNTATAPRIDN